MHILGSRLKKLRLQKQVTQKQIADTLGVTPLTIQRYEYGDREPNLNATIALADYFEVSLDYLVGRSDDPKRR